MQKIEATHGGNIWIYGGPEKILDFSPNSNPLGPPQPLIQALKQAFKTKMFMHYPEPTYHDLKNTLSSFLEVSQRNLEVLNGCSDAIYKLTLILNKPRTILIAPSFQEYWRASWVLNKKIHEINYIAKDNEYLFPTNEVLTTLNDSPEAILYICNPNNPTGTITPLKHIEEIVSEALRKGSHIIIDESFMDFSRKNESALALTESYPNLHVIKSLTKIFASPGLRLGVAVTVKSNQILKHSPPWRINIFASHAFTSLLKKKRFIKNYLKDARELVAKEKIKLKKTLEELGTNPYQTHTNFMLISLRKLNSNSVKLTKQLALKHKILIRDCSTIPGLNNKYVRISIRKPSENQKLLNALRETLNESP